MRRGEPPVGGPFPQGPPNLLATKSLSLKFPPFFLTGDQVNDIPPLKPRPPPSSPKKEPVAVSGDVLTMTGVIEYLEKRKNATSIDVNDIVSYFCIRRKAIFDFMSIMAALGCATRLSGTSYKWNGADVLDEAKAFMRQAKHDIEKEVSMLEKFACAKDASLGNITLNLLKLLAYLGRTTIGMKDVANLFVQGDARFSSMLRRLIAICNSLHATNIMKYNADSDTAELTKMELIQIVEEVSPNSAECEKRWNDFRKDISAYAQVSYTYN